MSKPDRLLAADALTHPVAPLPLRSEDVASGTPTAGLAELATLGGTSVGIWELSEGTVRDTEADEVFVVLAGSGTVTFLADGASLALAPGVVVRLHAGERTEWVVRSTLRKIYISA